MASRPSARIFSAFRSSAFRRTTNTPRFTRSYADASAAGEQSGFQKFWNSEVGPKTVHFWAPIMKWGVVLAGAADFARPAESLSISQNAALMATGAIWTRWCFVIKPRNLFLASVNFLLFCVGATQVSRAVLYQRSLEGKTVGEEVKSVAKEEGEDLKAAAKQAGKEVKAKA
ncbi:UPF0041-domain-containing protein [Myriangium duriaei CBS 260.36]|uniref:Mitochondrial pyruvate carrier n=1 Tax=Myriangium duriaei CBS 260.36 TaxID=1168546 RepID=A0A9P4J942_9PEZI|nr:UPF0041-domain-containing protein [Myriangium duriaei CBS 260.36]